MHQSLFICVPDFSAIFCHYTGVGADRVCGMGGGGVRSKLKGRKQHVRTCPRDLLLLTPDKLNRSEAVSESHESAW